MPGFPLPSLDVALSEELRFILNLGAAVAAALVGGAVAIRFRQPAVLGYLLAGIALGPFTPGPSGDVEQIAVLAEVGIVLLLFALGVEFSIRDLREIGRVAVPAGIAQILLILAFGGAIAVGLGFEPRASLVIGACLSISSTLVVLKLILERGESDSLHGRAAIGWAIVQDIATIVFIVGLPPLAGSDVVVPFVVALGKAVVFLALAYFLGTRVLPWVFNAVARLGSNELFLLAVFATALLAAFVSSAVFGLSLALGAFVGGLLVSESELSHQAGAEVIPFRDLFAVFFFVSVGMIFDPVAVLADLPAVVALFAVAVPAKALVVGVLGRLAGLPVRSTILLGAVMAQVGEFSFIIAEDALHLDLLDQRAYNLILGTAVLSILVSPIAITLADRLVAKVEWVPGPGSAAGPRVAAAAGLVPSRVAARFGAPAATASALAAAAPAAAPDAAHGDADRRPGIVVLGAGRVGRVVIKAARSRGFRVTVVDRDARRLDEPLRVGAATIYGDAANPEILKRLGLDRARVLVVAIGDPLTRRLATQRALAMNPRLSVASRVRGRREIDFLRGIGADRLADPEAEAAFELTRRALHRMGVSGMELTSIVAGLRRDAYGPEVS